MKKFNLLDFILKISIALVFILPSLTALSIRLLNENNALILLLSLSVLSVLTTTVRALQKKRSVSLNTRTFIVEKSGSYVALSLALAFLILSLAPFSMFSFILLISATIFYAKKVIDNYRFRLEEKAMQFAFFIIAFVAVVSMLNNFAGSQLIWLNLISLFFLGYALIENSDFTAFRSLKFKTLKKNPGKYFSNAFMLICIIGGLSAIFQFHSFELILGFNVLEAALTLFAMFLIYASERVLERWLKKRKLKAETARIKKEEEEREIASLEAKRKMKIKKQEEEHFKKLAIKSRLILTQPDYKLEDLITVSNAKRQIVWGPEMNLYFEVCREVITHSFDDKELEKIALFIYAMRIYIAEQKTSPTLYEGEKAIREFAYECLKKVKHLDTCGKNPAYI